MKYFIVWQGPGGSPRIETLGIHDDRPTLFDTKERAEVHVARNPAGRTRKSKVYPWPFAVRDPA